MDTGQIIVAIIIGVPTAVMMLWAWADLIDSWSLGERWGYHRAYKRTRKLRRKA